MRKIIGFLVVCSFIVGCQAKRVDPSAEGVDGADANLENTKTVTANLDGRINDLVGGIAGVNSKIKAILAVTNGTDKNYTPLDVVLEFLADAKKGVASKKDTSFHKQSTIDLEFLSQDDPCRKIKTSLDSAADVNGKIASATLSVTSACINSGQPVQIASASWVEDTLKLNINLYDLQNLMTNQSLGTLNKDLIDKTGCQLVRDSNQQLNSATCENLKIKVSDTIVTSFKKLSLLGSGDISASGSGEIRENDLLKGVFEFSIPRGGTPDVSFIHTNNVE